MEDGKLLFAYDRAKKATMLPTTEYFVRAVETVRRNKAHYAAAEARARMRHPVRPPHFDAFGESMAMMSAMAAMGDGDGGGLQPSPVHTIMTGLMRSTADEPGGSGS